MNEIEAIANNNEWELVSEFRLLEEVFDFLRIIEVTLATDALNLSDLTGASGSLDIFEVDFRVLAKIHNGTKIVVETYSVELDK